jgi:hypothetical protein
VEQVGSTTPVSENPKTPVTSATTIPTAKVAPLADAKTSLLIRHVIHTLADLAPGAGVYTSFAPMQWSLGTVEPWLGIGRENHDGVQEDQTCRQKFAA